MAERIVGVIGGVGLYAMEGLETIEEAKVSTPFGEPSDEFLIGTLEGVKMVFLPRHGKGHRIPPSDLNFRANIYGMKKLGVEWLISVSAVGSMKEEIKPGDIVIPDQFFDRTKGRVNSFFTGNVVGHINFADPVCPVLSGILAGAGKKVGAKIHQGGTYICIEGPQFSTRAESNIYRQWGVDIIGMTNIPEAKLAREAEICYATIALVTDYDCWRSPDEEVSIGEVMEVMRNSIDIAKQIIHQAVPDIKHPRECICATTLSAAILTNGKLIPEKLKKDLELLIGKYL
ncbi:MAG: S-methyl-5'-thioadenosine phosphorylase [Deltaproteobacteria bacterium]|nr:MAG: S-methyl-5'-thioadenosine phosphorylase [Deltaproteobacteria bacterium]